MADDILKEIQKDKDFFKEIEGEYINVKSMEIINKAALSEKLFVNYKIVDKALEIAGETIVDLSIENDELTKQLQQYGTYDEEKIEKAVNFKKTNTNNDDYNKILKQNLLRTINKSKAITN